MMERVMEVCGLVGEWSVVGEGGEHFRELLLRGLRPAGEEFFQLLGQARAHHGDVVLAQWG